MLLIQTLVLIAFVCTAESSIGTHLAEIVKKSSGSFTTEICILNDSMSSSWRKFLDDFLGIIFPLERFVVRRFATGVNVKKCPLYVIYLDPGLAINEINVGVNKLLNNGDRFAQFAFVSSVERVGKGEESTARYYYSRNVLLLALTNTVHVTLGEKDGLFTLFHQDFLLNVNGEVEVGEIEGILCQDRIENVNGYPFTVLASQNIPMMWVSPSLNGLDYNLLKAFARHINATLSFKILTKRWDEATLQHAFIHRTISMINVLRLVALYSEQQVTLLGNGLCIIVPETLIGSIFNHLMRPFSDASWIFLGFLLLFCIAIGNLFQAAFPRGIFNQVFYGSLTADSKMKLLERFTLFSAILILFLMSSAYEAKIFQLMFEKEFEPHLKTIQEIIEKDYLVVAKYGYSSDYLQPIFGKQLRSKYDENEKLNNRYATLKRCSFAVAFLQSKTNLDPNTGKRLNYQLQEQLSTFAAYTHSKLLPFRKKFLQVYNALFNAGLLNYWIQSFYDEVRHNALPTIDYLTFQDLVSLWKVIAYGQGFAFIIFILEFSFKLMELGIKKIMKYDRKMIQKNTRIRK